MSINLSAEERSATTAMFQSCFHFATGDIQKKKKRAKFHFIPIYWATVEKENRERGT